MICGSDCPHCNAPDDEERFSGDCPHCGRMFYDEDEWFEHVSCCEFERSKGDRNDE